MGLVTLLTALSFPVVILALESILDLLPQAHAAEAGMATNRIWEIR